MSNQFSVRACTRLQPGTTLPQVVQVLQAALRKHGLAHEGYLDMVNDAPPACSWRCTASP